jgi:hypothetical protein
VAQHRLTPGQVKAIALRAATPYSNGPSASGGPVTVADVWFSHIGKAAWLVRVHAASFRFGCEHAPPGSYCVPSFLPDPYALVMIEDATGRVLGVHAEPRCLSGQISTLAKPCLVA